MCLVTYCPKGKKKDSEEVINFIKSGARSNTQGSGFMFKRAGQNTITIDKGYFNIDRMIEALQSYKLTEDDELAIHHRISTSGKVSAENCHPFVISSKHEEVCATNITTKKACLVHNGVFRDLSSYMSLNPDFSDTYAFARYIMSNPQIKKIRDTDIDLFNTILKEILNMSKVVIFYPDKPVLMLGVFLERDGYFHSNGGYCSYSPNYGGQTRSAAPPRSFDWGEGYGGYYDHYNAYAGYGGEQPKIEAPKNTSTQEVDSEESSKGSVGEADSALLSKTTYFKCKPIDDVIRLVLLTKEHVTIDSENYSHFYFISPLNYRNALRNKIYDVSEIEDFSDISMYHMLKYRSKDPESGKFVDKWNKIHWTQLSDYYYIPKKDYIETYIDFMRLLFTVKGKEIGVNTIKKAESKINNTKNKAWTAKVRFGRLGRKASVTRLALELYLNYVKRLSKVQELNRIASENLKKQTEAIETDINTMTEAILKEAQDDANKLNITSEEARLLGLPESVIDAV